MTFFEKYNDYKEWWYEYRKYEEQAGSFEEHVDRMGMFELIELLKSW